MMIDCSLHIFKTCSMMRFKGLIGWKLDNTALAFQKMVRFVEGMWDYPPTALLHPWHWSEKKHPYQRCFLSSSHWSWKENGQVKLWGKGEKKAATLFLSNFQICFVENKKKRVAKYFLLAPTLLAGSLPTDFFLQSSSHPRHWSDGQIDPFILTYHIIIII